MGIGVGQGESRAAEAARTAVSSPLLESSIEGATGILLNITGPADLGLFEVNEAAEVVTSAADAERQRHLRRRDRRRHRRRGPRDRDRDRLRPAAPPPAADRRRAAVRPGPGAGPPVAARTGRPRRAVLPARLATAEYG